MLTAVYGDSIQRSKAIGISLAGSGIGTMGELFTKHISGFEIK